MIEMIFQGKSEGKIQGIKFRIDRDNKKFWISTSKTKYKMVKAYFENLLFPFNTITGHNIRKFQLLGRKEYEKTQKLTDEEYIKYWKNLMFNFGYTLIK